MALPSTVYRATIQLSHVDRGIYDTLQATLARHPSETAERLVLRLLAFAICYGPDVAFTRGVGAGDEPDLWVKGGDGRVALCRRRPPHWTRRPSTQSSGHSGCACGPSAGGGTGRQVAVCSARRPQIHAARAACHTVTPTQLSPWRLP